MGGSGRASPDTPPCRAMKLRVEDGAPDSWLAPCFLFRALTVSVLQLAGIGLGVGGE